MSRSLLLGASLVSLALVVGLAVYPGGSSTRATGAPRPQERARSEPGGRGLALVVQRSTTLTTRVERKREELMPVDPSRSTLTVRVVTSRGNPLLGAAVSLARGAHCIREERADASGAVFFGALKPGVYDLSLVPESLPPGLLPPPSAQRLFRLRAGDARSVELVALRAASLRGLVADVEGMPLAGAQVRLASLEPAVDARQEVVLVGDDGSYGWSDLRPGRYRLSLVSGRGTTSTAVPLEVDLAEGDAQRHDLWLEPASARIAGRIVDELGEPFASLRLRARSETGVLASATSDANGLFAFDHLPASPVFVEVHPLATIPRGRSALRKLQRGFDPILTQPTPDRTLDLGTLFVERSVAALFPDARGT